MELRARIANEERSQLFNRSPVIGVMRTLVLLTLAFTCIRGVSGFAATAVPSTSTAQILKDLRAFPQHVRWRESPYYDMHGNANEGLQILMIRRFEATSDLCRELDAVSFESHPAYGASLYRVLGTVKDPTSIPWLERHLKGPSRKQIYDHWLREWYAYLRGAAPLEISWVTGTNEWSKFFRSWATSETSETNRMKVLRVMQGWMHDPATQAFFKSLERDSKATDEEVLLAQVYLRQHDIPFDETKLRAITGKIRQTPGGARVLLRYAAAIRSEAFVAGLVDIADEKMEEEFMTPQRALEALTFQQVSSWKDWYAVHGQKSRRVWMDDAASRVASMAKTNTPAANAVLSKVMYTWDDPAMLPHMERLATVQQLRSAVVGWINLTYHEVPFLRNRLLPLASKIRAEGVNELESWARNLMGDWDFFAPVTITWEQYVRTSHMRV